VTDSDADAAWLYSWITSGTDLNNDVGSGPGRLWGTNNTVYGAAPGEQILTGSGDDIIFGRGGADQITSAGGNDTVTGGRGGDEFVEIRDGSLTITDFHDLGPRALQDVIRMTIWEYRHMPTAQVGSDTVLTVFERFGHGDSHLITLQDYDMTRLDVHDFVFGF